MISKDIAEVLEPDMQALTDYVKDDNVAPIR